MQKQFLEAGKIIGTKGLKGELRIESWCDSLEFLLNFKVLYFNKGSEEFKVKSSKIQKKTVIMTIDGVNTIDDANLFIGKMIYINRNDVKLPKGSYFIQDLIGLRVIDVDTNVKYGIISQVYKTGANDVYEITDDNDKKYLIPVIDEVIINTDIKNETIQIRPIKGIFEDEV